MNIQTEHLENHTTRLTVQVEPDRVEQAMREAGRRIASKARIKGFRPGKAPYNVILNLYGHEYVLGEALDKLGNEIYREALDEADLEPYAPGSLEDVNEEDGLTLTFVVPRRPSVELGDYRSIRVDYEVSEVTDKMVEDTLEQLREQHVVVEDVERAAKLGDKVTFEHFEVVQLDDDDDADAEEADEPDDDMAEETPEEASDEVDDAADEDADAEDVEADDIDDEDDEDDEDNVLIHQHHYERVLTDGDQDLFPGFSAQVVGLSAGDEKTFELSVPDDYDVEDIAGRTLRCEVHVEKVQARTVPEWTDELAKKISEEEFETLLDLRMDVRRRLEENAKNQADQEAADEALDQLVEMSTIHYPEELVDDYTTEILNELDMNLRQQGIGLEDFMRITGRQESDLRAQYREQAAKRAERSLALTELVEAEELTVSDADIDAEIKTMSESLGGDQAEQFMQFLNTEQSRMNISSRLATNRIIERLVAIARGENPPKGPGAAAEDETAEDETAAAASADAENSAESAETETTTEPTLAAETETAAEGAGDDTDDTNLSD